jgi:DNA-binding NarL/FixJ family response regulator
MQGRPLSAPNGPLCLHRLLAGASLQVDAIMSGPEPSFAQMVRIYDLCARGLSAKAIAERLGLAVEQVQIVLNPPPRTTP